jgi:hypothetical protein
MLVNIAVTLGNLCLLKVKVALIVDVDAYRLPCH